MYIDIACKKIGNSLNVGRRHFWGARRRPVRLTHFEHMHIRNKTPMIVNSKINDRRKEQALEGWMTKTGTYTHKKVQMKHGKVKETYSIG